MQTILGTFDDTRAAQNAVDRLVAQGFSRDRIHLETSSLATTAKPHEHHGFLADIEHFFSSLFESDKKTDAGNYAEAVRRGSTVVAVDAINDSEVDKATKILREFGSVDVDKRAAQWKSEGWKGFDPNAQPMACATGSSDVKKVMPVVEEELQVGKRTVEGGGVRVIKRVTETPVTELVKLREERATVERRPVDRPATEADFTNFKEGTIEVREKSEQVVVNKQARVVEEVIVGKEVTEREATVSDSVRRTDVKVERVPGKNTP